MCHWNLGKTMEEAIFQEILIEFSKTNEIYQATD